MNSGNGAKAKAHSSMHEFTRSPDAEDRYIESLKTLLKSGLLTREEMRNDRKTQQNEIGKEERNVTILGITFSAAVIWIIAAGLLAIIEAFTLGLTTIWFAGGAVCASAAAMFGAPVIVQIAVFLAISVLLLVITRPIVKRRLRQNRKNKC